eukprot:gnl/TRDRNA2_/TRDRNA2_125377_c0_seq1.p1 gnl/TRDRNA2_/TRDRNA2_125377_c0~~gnl/TRDRNA2_/TRDRNA2_125377_c0_seq1.p1  ORF type:complete len:304 (-),score=41.18 gnl/TRDRNA2_/TRDRNA2_125377_c0_seq1:9-920(-)
MQCRTPLKPIGRAPPGARHRSVEDSADASTAEHGGFSRKVTVGMLDGTVLTLHVGKHTRVWQIKSRLENRFGKTLAGVQLLFGTKVLSDWEPVPVPEQGEQGSCGDDQRSMLTLVRVPSRVKEFLEKNDLDSINSTVCGGCTVLHLAIRKDDSALCHEILARDDFSGVNAVDFLGSTALHQAVGRGLTSVCAAILGHRDFIAVNVRNRNGHSALHLAALRGDERTCAAMSAHPNFDAASAGAADALGCTAVDMACEQTLDVLQKSCAQQTPRSARAKWGAGIVATGSRGAALPPVQGAEAIPT